MLGAGILAAARYRPGRFLVEADLARSDAAGFGARGGGTVRRCRIAGFAVSGRSGGCISYLVAPRVWSRPLSAVLAGADSVEAV